MVSSRQLSPAGDPEPDGDRGALILIRHGRTCWNDKGLIIGWEDPPLNEAGTCEATRAGQLISALGLPIANVFTSPARRTTATVELVLAALDGPSPIILADWRLNERHFGLLQGLDRTTAAELYGRKALRAWKHDPVAVPPPVPPEDGRHPVHDNRYSHVERQLLPGAESNAQHGARVLECWRDSINVHLERGVNVLVVGHCHSLRILENQINNPPSFSASPSFSLPGAAYLYLGRESARELS